MSDQTDRLLGKLWRVAGTLTDEQLQELLDVASRLNGKGDANALIGIHSLRAFIDSHPLISPGGYLVAETLWGKLVESDRFNRYEPDAERLTLEEVNSPYRWLLEIGALKGLVAEINDDPHLLSLLGIGLDLQRLLVGWVESL